MLGTYLMRTAICAALIFIFVFAHLSFATEQSFQNDFIHVKIITDDNASPNTPFSVKTAFIVDGKAVELADLSLSMRMRNMNMGKFDYKPLFDKASVIYIFNPIILPFCMSGKKEWVGTLKYKYNFTEYETIFIINLQ